jgi:hypothetical protein
MYAGQGRIHACVCGHLWAKGQEAVSREYQWTISPDDPMLMLITHHGKIVMRIGMHEAIESSSRTAVLQHVAECDRTPWLKRWQEEKNQTMIELLKQDYT